MTLTFYSSKQSYYFMHAVQTAMNGIPIEIEETHVQHCDVCNGHAAVEGQK